MSDSHKDPQTAVNDAAIILPAIAMVVLLSVVPVALFLVWLKVINPGYFRRNVLREGELPTTEQPTSKPKHYIALYRRARAVILKLRGVAIAAGGGIALRSREVVDRVRRRIPGLFDGRDRRCSGKWRPPSYPGDLPIMHQKSWRILAESHTERTFTGPENDKVEHETVEKPKRSPKTVHFYIGDEDNDEPCVRKPGHAVVAESKTGS